MNWFQYNSERNTDPQDFHINKVLKFIYSLFQDLKFCFSYIKQHTQTLFLIRKIIKKPFTVEDKYVIKLTMESIFKRIPPPFKVPKQTWNINILFNYFLSLNHNQNLSLVELSRKLATLLMIATMCRKAELVLLSLDRVEAKTSSYITFRLDGPTKTANHHMSMKRLKELSEFKVQKFPGDIKLCPLAALKEYIKRTHRIRNTRKLFISNCPPFQRAKSTTISA